jgi:hypothetical protein
MRLKIARARADENVFATFNYRIRTKQQGKTLITQAYFHSKATVYKTEINTNSLIIVKVKQGNDKKTGICCSFFYMKFIQYL